MDLYTNTIERLQEVDPVNARMFILDALEYYARHINSGIITAPDKKENDAYHQLSNQVLGQSKQYDEYLNNVTSEGHDINGYAKAHEESISNLDQDIEQQEVSDEEWNLVVQEADERTASYDDDAQDSLDPKPAA